MKYRFLATLLLVAALPAFSQLPNVPGEPSRAAKSQPTPVLRLAPAAPAFEVSLPPVSREEVEAVRERNRPRSGGPREQLPARITLGIARPVEGAEPTAASFPWQRVAGGYAARVAVTSPRAGSLRVAIDLAGVPHDVEMVFQGSDVSRVEGPVRAGEIADRTVPWWSPLTEGETQSIEFFVPESHEPAKLPLSIAGTSHAFSTPSSGFTKHIEDIGLAGSCNVDVACSPLASNAAFRNAAESVAQMVFSDRGFLTLCTGTLLADSDPSTQTPWFFGANHCFDNEEAPFKTPAQMQVVANTLTTLWGFEASSCGSRAPRTGWTQLGAGATLMFNDVASDVLFLRLNATPPASAFFSGWDANPLQPGNALVSLHHPQGDLKKATQGSVVRFATPGVGGGNASFSEVRWSSGTTEQGSSGGGIWTTSGSQYSFRGALYGGTASCSALTAPDYFSRFDQAWPALAPYLGAANAAIDYTDLWWNPQESGWGLNLTQHPSRAIFGVWYTYELDGTRTWYVMPGGTWTSPNTYTGALYTTVGPAFTEPFDPGRVDPRQVGTATLTFTDANNGVFAYSIDGVSGSKVITRQPF